MTQPLTPGAFAKALQDKRDSERRRRFVVWGIAGGLALLLAVGVYLAFFSPVFAARKVEVTGVKLLTAEQVTQAAQVRMDAPLLRQDIAGITERVRTLAPVSDVTVERSLPDTVVIRVTERTLAYQKKRDGQVDWVDTHGVVFHASEKPTAGVIQVTADGADDRLLRDIATVVTSLPEPVAEQVTGLKAAAVDRITLTLTDRRSVVWGSAEESDLKGTVLEALLSVEAKVYDVSAPRHPTTK